MPFSACVANCTTHSSVRSRPPTANGRASSKHSVTTTPALLPAASASGRHHDSTAARTASARTRRPCSSTGTARETRPARETRAARKACPAGEATAAANAGPAAATRASARPDAATRPDGSPIRTDAHAAAARTAAPAAGPKALVHEHPLVVVIAIQEQPDRLFLALAADALHAAGNRVAEPGRVAVRTETAGRGRRSAGNRLLRPAASRLRRSLHASRIGIRGRDPLEVCVRDRVLVSLPEEALLHEVVDARRQRLGLHVEEPDRAHVLLTAPDQLLFFFPLGVVPPHRQRDRHQHRHDGKHHEQGRHGVAAVTASSVLTP